MIEPKNQNFNEKEETLSFSSISVVIYWLAGKVKERGQFLAFCCVYVLEANETKTEK